MKVLITGGAGYIGSHTNRYFAKMGADTIVLDNLSNGHAEAVKWGTLVKGDIGDEKLLDMLLARKILREQRHEDEDAARCGCASRCEVFRVLVVGRDIR